LDGEFDSPPSPQDIMARINLDNGLSYDCRELGMHCDDCILGGECNKVSVDLTSELMDMLMTCRRRKNNKVSCDGCRYRFKCYTTKLVKYV